MFYFPAENEAKSINERYDKKGPKWKRLLQERYLLQYTALSPRGFESAGQLGAFYVEFARSLYVCVASFCVFELPPTVQRHVSLTGESKLAVGVNMIINAFGRSVLAVMDFSKFFSVYPASCPKL